jgi:hypothetical protein
MITVNLTGLGSVDVLGRPIQPLTATLGGQIATIVFAQMSPITAGLFEVHLLVSRDRPRRPCPDDLGKWSHE